MIIDLCDHSLLLELTEPREQRCTSSFSKVPSAFSWNHWFIYRTSWSHWSDWFDPLCSMPMVFSASKVCNLRLPTMQLVFFKGLQILIVHFHTVKFPFSRVSFPVNSNWSWVSLPSVLTFKLHLGTTQIIPMTSCHPPHKHEHSLRLWSTA